MNKLIIYFGMCILLSLMVSGAYTPDVYDDVDVLLEGGYTPDSYDAVVVTMNPSATNDSCSCAGLNQNWEVDLSDYCVITDACDLGTGTLSFTGSGNMTCDAVISTTNLGDPGANGIIYINDDCVINVD